MKKISFLLIVIFVNSVFALDFNIQKTDMFRKPKHHPYQQFLEFSEISKRQKRIKPNIERNKVLVMLVDFQTDDTSTTSGNGKFLTEVDPNYPIALGAPPHDREFYETIMNAVYHYYQAVSHDFFNMQYDVYPKNKQAYTLPHEMAYYNPGIDNQELFLKRTELYFEDVFETADQDSSIVFSKYDHFIIIHAGSDWQHDVLGNSPNDLPTIHIALQPEKVIPVDDGNTLISYAISVPEATTQDVRSSVNNSEADSDVQTKTFSGYGLTTPNIVHEFGHSLGLVDLYDTRTNVPRVGYYDIMDSGGSGISTTIDDQGNYYEVEGILPGLPGAPNRILLWGEDFYREKKLLKDLKDISFDKDVEVRTISKFYNQLHNQTFMVKIPVSEYEYLLIENRQLNPYNRQIVLKGALPITPGGTDYRVPIYPVLAEDLSNKPNYAYDMLLPGFVRNVDGGRYIDYFGGGLLFWYVDEYTMYHKGRVLDDGTFVSNFDLNTINNDYLDLGIKVIEADGLEDIGSQNSFYWKGTAYEPFYKHLPEIDTVTGFATGWSEEIHKDEFTSSTNPPFLRKNGEPVLYKIYGISDSRPGSVNENGDFTLGMTFRIGTNGFYNTEKVFQVEKNKNFKISPIFSTYLTSSTGIAGEFSLIYDKVNQSFSHFYDTVLGYDYWRNEKPYFEHGIKSDFPVMVNYLNDNKKMYTFVTGKNKYAFFYENHGRVNDVPYPVTDTPVLWKDKDKSYIAVATEQKLFIESIDGNFNIDLSIKKAKIYYSGKYLIAQIEGYVYMINTDDFTKPIRSYRIPDLKTDLRLACFEEDLDNPYIFAINSENIVYRIYDDNVKKILDLNIFETEYTSQIGLGFEKKYNLNYFTFATNNRVFAMDFDGNFLPNFPVPVYNFNVSKESDVFCIAGEKGDGETLFSNLYFKDENNGYFVTSVVGEIDVENSLYWQKNHCNVDFYWEDVSKRLYLLYSDVENNVLVSYKKDCFDENPIHWDGYKNGFNGSRKGEILNLDLSEDEKSVLVYPNPSINNNITISCFSMIGEIKIKIYDIAGNLIHEGKFEGKETAFKNDYREWDIKNVTSGVYIAVITNGSYKKQVKIVIRK